MTRVRQKVTLYSFKIVKAEINVSIRTIYEYILCPIADSAAANIFKLGNEQRAQ